MVSRLAVDGGAGAKRKSSSAVRCPDPASRCHLVARVGVSASSVTRRVRSTPAVSAPHRAVSPPSGATVRSRAHEPRSTRSLVRERIRPRSAGGIGDGRGHARPRDARGPVPDDGFRIDRRPGTVRVGETHCRNGGRAGCLEDGDARSTARVDVESCRRRHRRARRARVRELELMRARRQSGSRPDKSMSNPGGIEDARAFVEFGTYLQTTADGYGSERRKRLASIESGVGSRIDESGRTFRAMPFYAPGADATDMRS